MDWKLGEEVFIWGANSNSFIKGIVKSVDRTLGVLFFSNGKIYHYNLDGSAIDPLGITNQRVFSVRKLNEVTVPSDIQEAM